LERLYLPPDRRPTTDDRTTDDVSRFIASCAEIRNRQDARDGRSAIRMALGFWAHAAMPGEET
jgi:hypothetical protein